MGFIAGGTFPVSTIASSPTGSSYKAIKARCFVYNIPIVYVDPRNINRTCSRLHYTCKLATCSITTIKQVEVQLG